jgi:WhiB family redox-sensing transcriptional regulator
VCSYIGAIVGEELPMTERAQTERRFVDLAEMLAVEEEDKSWQRQANCMGVDPDLFFPDRGASTREAKEVCRGCVVREDCLEYAIVHSEKFGIWGGLSERERRRIRRRRSVELRTGLLGGGAAS